MNKQLLTFLGGKTGLKANISKILLVLVAAVAANAQTSNVHFGVMSGFADSNVTYGVTGGLDRRIGSYLISGDVDAFHLCKHAANGGCGYEYHAQGTVARNLTERFALQSGIAESQYSVTRYNKSSFQYLVGARYALDKGLVTELNYRHDLTSPNHVHFFESRTTLYTKKHLFFRATGVINVLQYAGSQTTTGSLTLAAGVHF